MASEFFGEARLTTTELKSVQQLSGEVAAEFFAAAASNEEAAETEYHHTELNQKDVPGANVDKVMGAEHRTEGKDDEVHPHIDVHARNEALAAQLGEDYV